MHSSETIRIANPIGKDKVRTVLFVDDEMVFLELVERLFRLWSKDSLKVLCCHSVGRAISLLQENEVDIIVTDIQMPVVDGLQFLKLLHRKHPNMKKVVLTGVVEEQCRSTCLASGASLFMQKPRNAEEMESVYASIVELANSKTEVGFSGVLQRANLGEMVQMFCLGGSSVVLELESSIGGGGKIFISKGSVLHAIAPGHDGYDAFYYLMSMQGGVFTVKPFAEPTARTISGSWEALLLESARQTDEARAIKPSTDSPEVDFRERFKTVPLPRKLDESLEQYFTNFSEAVFCSATGEIKGSVGLQDPAMRADLLDFIEVKGRQMSRALGLQPLREVSAVGLSFNALMLLKTSGKSFALSEQKKLTVDQLREKLESWGKNQTGVSA